ncbi:hypothetical protein Poli38472_005642 [Pythium oligandrum]|uniref:CCR4-NOT transcription complex subunit 4 n=1 Tax=Pythium oligandrum TaxID=41045 RepID=A0A8K1CGC4_PYTOL|nr:hypothetical protein Poli38472_005642 [Pythium oligandrum]|eukprot:TMW63024.1 hypothetical protein Poli38472_005642 [Pythium oligandrum]
MSSIDEEENECCPLCMEELDLTDKTFNACPCGYQVCLWCWHQIKNEYNALCPACRAPYAELTKQKAPLDREDVLRRTKQRKQKEKSERRTASQSKIPSVNRKNLANVRVMQRNLVYVIGLPQQFADEDILRSNECFGQYGKIIKAVVNKSHLNSDRANATASAYITFSNKDDALSCIIAIDGYYIDGCLLRASFGTTKYCNFFLRSLQCNNPDCLYLHELGDQDDSFTKEEMQTALHSGKAAFRDLTANEVRAGPRFPPPFKLNATEASAASRSSPGAAAAAGTSSPGAASAAPASADAQRKAQSAAAIYKLQREDSYSRIVSGGALPRGPDTELGPRLVSTDSGAFSPPPATATTEDRKPDLRVDTGVGLMDSVVGPLEALKLATGSTSQEPAWAQPFPSPSVLQSEPDDVIAPPAPVFSPFGMGFNGGIRANPQTTNDPWRTMEAEPLGGPGALGDLGSNDRSSFRSSQPFSAPFASAPESPKGLSSGGQLSFASIDAIFTPRNEPSEALAGLLGMQMNSAAPLVHGPPKPVAPAVPKTTRSSRFAFANQDSAPPSSLGGLGGSYNSLSDPALASPFGYSGFGGAPNGSPNATTPFPSTSDPSAFPPLGAGLRSSNSFTSDSGDAFNSHGGFGASSMDSSSSGLAFLQQMLPNVNISFGGEYATTGGNPRDGMGGSSSAGNAWGSSGGLNGLGFDSRPSNPPPSSQFYDPAIVSASSGLGGFYGYGNGAASEEERRLESAFGGGYRAPGSVMDN